MTRVLTKSLAEFLIIFWLLWAGDTLNLIFVSFQETFDINTDLKKYTLFEWHQLMTPGAMSIHKMSLRHIF